MPFLLTAPVLAQAPAIRPMNVWRGGWEPRRFPPSVAATGLLALFLYGSLVQQSWKAAAGCCGVLMLVLGAAVLCSRLLLGSMRRISALPLAVSWKHGLANLHRPGNYALPVLAALAAAAAFLSASSLLERTLLGDWQGRSPFRGYNLFLLNVPPTQAAPIEQDLNSTGALEAAPQFVSFSRVRLGSRDFLATSSAAKPPSLEIVAGKWWAENESHPLAALHYSLARRLNLTVGQSFRLICGGRQLECKLAAVHRSHGPAAMAYDFTLNPAAVRDLPFIFNGAAKVAPARLAEIEMHMIESHPSIVVLDAGEALSYVRYASERVAWMVRSLSVFTLCTGIFVLMLGVTSTSMRRVHETAVFRILGATKGKLAGIMLVEYASLGLFAGATGAAFGTIVANAALVFLLGIPPSWPGATALALFITVAAVATTAAGSLACLPILKSKPLPVLRLDS
jgi:putative ABC transport system permease protein